MPSTSSPRLDYLDAARAFALLLGIAFHASLSFTPVYFGWAVMDISASPVVSSFMLISHSFRMPLFFLLAGFFTHMSLQKTGGKTLLKSRLVRIGLPLIIGWFILRPLLVSGWVMGGDSLRGDVDIIKGLTLGFESLKQLPSGLLTGSHLWFLYYLLLFTITAVALQLIARVLSPIKSAQPFIAERGTGNEHASSILAATCSLRMNISILSIPTAACLWFMSHWGIDTPDKSLIPNLPVTLLYGGFFYAGWILFTNAISIEKFSAITFEKIFTVIIAIILCIKLSAYESQVGHEYYPWLKGLYVISYASMTWSLVALTIGVFRVVIARPNRITRYFSDASYWLYLVHLPIVIWLQIAVAELPWHWGVKWMLVTITTISVSILLYDLFVRPTLIGKLLNGRTKPSVIFSRKIIAANKLCTSP